MQPLALIQTIKFKFSEDNPSYSNTPQIHNVQDAHKYGTTCLISVAIFFCHNFKKKYARAEHVTKYRLVKTYYYRLVRVVATILT